MSTGQGTDPSIDRRPTVDDELARVAPDVLDRVNGAFPDSLLFVARVLGGAHDAIEAEAVGVDARGVDLSIVTSDGEQTARIDFAAPVDDAAHVGLHLLGLVTLARERSGEPGATSAERELGRAEATRTFLTTVAANETVHAHLRRITLAGGDLTTFAPLGPDTFVYVLLPPPGRAELTIDRSFTWEQFEEMPPAEQPAGAYYTVRAWRPETAELDLLVVLHDTAGPASGWAEEAQPGDPVALWGPREAFEPPADTAWYLLVADDTGLPAVAAILEFLPPGTPAFVVGEVADESERQVLRTGEGVEVTWVHRDGAAPGTVAGRTLDAVRALQLPDGPGYVWGGGESRAMTGVRKHVRHERGLPRERVSLIAYWRRDVGTAEDGAG